MDFRSFNALHTYWWNKDNQEESTRALWTSAKALENDNGTRSQDHLKWARLYGDFDSFNGVMARSAVVHTKPRLNRLALNVVASCVDTLDAKIGKNQPRPEFITFGGDWTLHRKARRLNKFTQGLFYQTKFHRARNKARRDSFIFGTGCLKHYIKNGKVCSERVLPDELLVDGMEGAYGKPPSIIQRQSVPREVAYACFGDTTEKKDFIVSAPRVQDVDRNYGDLIEIYEAWHLPSDEDAGDGKHMLIVHGGSLLDTEEEAWDKNYFPFSFLRFSERIAGFWGQGISERLCGIQLEINYLLKKIQECTHLVSRPRFWNERGSKIIKTHINNDIGTIVDYTGKRPELDNSNSVPPELFAQLDRLWERAFQEIGISQLSAQAKKPAGLDAAVALREYNDIESDRFFPIGKADEDFVLDSAEIMLDLVRDAAKDGKYEVTLKAGRYLEKLSWKDVDIHSDTYQMQCFPVSSLPSTPAARRQELMEWVNAGWISPIRARRLMNIPDLESESSIATAALDNSEWVIDKILDEGEYTPPDEYQNLSLLSEMAIQSLLQARFQGCPQERLEMLQTLIDQTVMLEAAGAPPAPPMPANGAAPMAPEAGMVQMPA